jgi:hypothetical protein
MRLRIETIILKFFRFARSVGFNNIFVMKFAIAATGFCTNISSDHGACGILADIGSGAVRGSDRSVFFHARYE